MCSFKLLDGSPGQTRPELYIYSMVTMQLVLGVKCDHWFARASLHRVVKRRVRLYLLLHGHIFTQANPIWLARGIHEPSLLSFHCPHEYWRGEVEVVAMLHTRWQIFTFLLYCDWVPAGYPESAGPVSTPTLQTAD